MILFPKKVEYPFKIVFIWEWIGSSSFFKCVQAKHFDITVLHLLLAMLFRFSWTKLRNVMFQKIPNTKPLRVSFAKASKLNCRNNNHSHLLSAWLFYFSKE